MVGRQDPELTLRLEDAVDNCELAIRRATRQLHLVEPGDLLPVLSSVIARLDAWQEDTAILAARTGSSYAAIARAVGCSRQHARTWLLLYLDDVA